MQLDFTNLFNGSNETICVDYTVDLSQLIYSTYNPIKNGVKVIGKAYNKADVVYFDIAVDFDFNGFCDRCAEPFDRHYSFELNKILVPALNNEDDDFDNYIVVDNNVLNLDEFINQEVQLFLPSKMLCKQDCKGLCQKCGKNLNVEKCDCKKDVDPRMEALLQLLDED